MRTGKGLGSREVVGAEVGGCAVGEGEGGVIFAGVEVVNELWDADGVSGSFEGSDSGSKVSKIYHVPGQATEQLLTAQC